MSIPQEITIEDSASVSVSETVTDSQITVTKNDSYAKVVEWYGGKEQFLSVANNPISKEAAESYNQQFDNLLYKLAAKKVCSPDSSEVRELVSEYGFLMKQLSQIKKEHGLMVAQAQYYRNEKIKPMIDEKYGNGTAEFFAQAFEAFYKDK